MQIWSPNPGLMRPSPVLCPQPWSSLRVFWGGWDSLALVFLTHSPPLPFPSKATAHLLSSLCACESLYPSRKRAKGRPGAQGMKFQRVQSKDHVVAANR